MTKIDIDAIAREAGLVVDVSTDPNSPPSWWACGHDPAFKKFAALLLEKAAQVCDGMHEEDRPGDYADAIRSMAAGMGE
ncbi:MAG TPA: hypothetical protein VFM33_13915 [Aquabacterium sp.]|nr:hypothetical protein [Aquabacterium sp.]